MKNQLFHHLFQVFILAILLLFFSPMTYSQLPVPDIKINASDGPLLLNSAEDKVLVSVQLDAAGRTDNADWFVASSTPFGMFFYTLNGWTDLITPIVQIPLQPLPNTQLINFPTLLLPSGEYALYFAVDTDMDGTISWEQLYFDVVEFTVLKPPSSLVKKLNALTVMAKDEVTGSDKLQVLEYVQKYPEGNDFLTIKLTDGNYDVEVHSQAAAFFLMGVKATLTQNRTVALWCFLEAAKLNPGQPDYLNNAAFILLEHDRYEDAEEILKYAIGLAPTFSSLSANLAVASAKSGQYEEAGHHYLNAFYNQPQTTEYILRAAESFEKAGQEEFARSLIEVGNAASFHSETDHDELPGSEDKEFMIARNPPDGCEERLEMIPISCAYNICQRPEPPAQPEDMSDHAAVKTWLAAATAWSEMDFAFFNPLNDSSPWVRMGSARYKFREQLARVGKENDSLMLDASIRYWDDCHKKLFWELSDCLDRIRDTNIHTDTCICKYKPTSTECLVKFYLTEYQAQQKLIAAEYKAYVDWALDIREITTQEALNGWPTDYLEYLLCNSRRDWEIDLQERFFGKNWIDQPARLGTVDLEPVLRNLNTWKGLLYDINLQCSVKGDDQWLKSEDITAGFEESFCILVLCLIHDSVNQTTGVSVNFGPSVSLSYDELEDDWVLGVGVGWQPPGAGFSYAVKIALSGGKISVEREVNIGPVKVGHVLSFESRAKLQPFTPSETTATKSGT